MTGTTAASGRHARQEHRARSLLIGLGLAAGLVVSAAGITAAVVTAGQPASITVPGPVAHAAPPAVPGPVVTGPAPSRPARAVYVTVRAGQCLWSIARAHHVALRALYRVNRRT